MHNGHYRKISGRCRTHRTIERRPATSRSSYTLLDAPSAPDGQGYCREWRCEMATAEKYPMERQNWVSYREEPSFIKSYRYTWPPPTFLLTYRQHQMDRQTVKQKEATQLHYRQIQGWRRHVQIHGMNSALSRATETPHPRFFWTYHREQTD